MPNDEFIRSRQMVAEMAQRALERLRPHVLHTLPDNSLLRLVPAVAESIEPALLSDGKAWESEAPQLQFFDQPLIDGAGQTRPVYFPLALHVSLLAGYADDLEALIKVLAASTDPQDPAMVLWKALCQWEASEVLAIHCPGGTLGEVDAALTKSGPGGSLHPLAPEQSLDSWTYQELTGLHALTHLALKTGIRGNPQWLSRVQEIANYHLENTQPDHTTSQPWGLPAFLLWDDTRIFGQQQLHDAAAQGLGTGDDAKNGAAVDVVTGLLLADSAFLLATVDR